MRITLLNGTPADARYKNFELFLEKLAIYLDKDRHTVTNLKLRNMDIKYCTGCFGCWVKTPGECLIADDSRTVRRESINCDLLVFASPIIMGFVSAVLKKSMDKMIPLVLPYIEIVEKECHHRKRYNKYPSVGLILDKPADNRADDEDIAITRRIFERLSLNLRSSLRLVAFDQTPIEEVINEINHI